MVISRQYNLSDDFRFSVVALSHQTTEFMIMKILNSEKNLASYLGQIRGSEITIITAFASGTEDDVDLLLKNDNKLELIIGTINSFSSPDFMEYCVSNENKNLSLYVDFGYQESIHWKLYLINPETVIIGSANFTKTGLSLLRDTCLVINDEDLLKKYKKELVSLKASSNVVGCNHEDFHDHFKKYRESHRRMQAGRARIVQAISVEKWLGEEENQLIPVFIWEYYHTKDEESKAHKLLEESSGESSVSMLRDWFTLECNESNVPYKQGDVVLCMKSSGNVKQMDFFTFDRILHEDGRCYIYSYRQKHYMRPFRLTDEIKKEIKNIVGVWYERDIIELKKSEIQSLAKNAT